MKKITTVLLSSIIAASSCYAVPAFAEEPSVSITQEGEAEPFSSRYFSNFSARIKANGGGKLTLSVNIIGTPRVNEVAVREITLQERTNTGWKKSKNFVQRDNPSFSADNTNLLKINVSTTGTRGKTYRIVVTMYAADSTSGETKIVTSNSVVA